MRIYGVVSVAFGLSGCATVINGSHQSVTVVTDPPGASCLLARAAETVAAIPVTPGSVQVSKSKNDMTVSCEKPDYQAATLSQAPHFGGATFGNIIAGGVVGVVVDAASGANYTYPSEVHVVMVPVQTGATSAAAAGVAGSLVSASLHTPPGSSP